MYTDVTQSHSNFFGQNVILMALQALFLAITNISTTKHMMSVSYAETDEPLTEELPITRNNW